MRHTCEVITTAQYANVVIISKATGVVWIGCEGLTHRSMQTSNSTITLKLARSSRLRDKKGNPNHSCPLILNMYRRLHARFTRQLIWCKPLLALPNLTTPSVQTRIVGGPMVWRLQVAGKYVEHTRQKHWLSFEKSTSRLLQLETKSLREHGVDESYSYPHEAIIFFVLPKPKLS